MMGSAFEGPEGSPYGDPDGDPEGGRKAVVQKGSRWGTKGG